MKKGGILQPRHLCAFWWKNSRHTTGKCVLIGRYMGISSFLFQIRRDSHPEIRMIKNGRRNFLRNMRTKFNYIR